MEHSSTEPEGHDSINLKQLKAAIPSYCFHSSTVKTLAYMARDLTVCCCMFYLTTYIPLIQILQLRQFCWLTYGVVQGLVFTGIWILAHECGHQALFKDPVTNDAVGFILHSFLLVPYYSWKYSHAKHHRYTNHMERDTAFVPPKKRDSRVLRLVEELLHVSEDAPFLNLMLLIAHQLVGWPLYLISHITAGKKSGIDAQGNGTDWLWCHNHFNPWSDLFSKSQRLFILISDLGLLVMALILRRAVLTYGAKTVLLSYGVPYLWANHWLVAITYLHHNHHATEHFGERAWSFQRGALSTVDRNFGFVGRHFFHGIIEFHVVHHIFNKIPFYYAEDATQAIKPLLGDRYLRDETPFLKSLWNTFTSLHYVEPREVGSEIFIWGKTLSQRENLWKLRENTG